MVKMSISVSQSPGQRPQMSYVHKIKDIQFTVTDEERNQRIFTLKKLESENFDFFSYKSTRLLNSLQLI